MKKLLLADDSITIQKVVGIIFATEDYQLVVTDDGDSAFSKALEEIPDLVIADISMPGKDGFELCRAIKSEPSLVDTSVLLLPGAFDHFDEVKAQEVCADGWLTKPFESQAFLDKVAKLLEAEPVRMDVVAVPAVESHAQVVDLSDDQPVDETVLGFDEIDELIASTEELEEESPDDIWDAISFAEDDLQEQSTASVKTSEEEVSVAAEVFEQSEIVPEIIDAPTEVITDVEPILGETASELTDKPAEVDYSVFNEAAENHQELVEDMSEETTPLTVDIHEDESLELTDENVEDSVIGAAETEEIEPLELMEDDLALQDSEVEIAESVAESTEEGLSKDDDIIDLYEKEIVVDDVESIDIVEPEAAVEVANLPEEEIASAEEFDVQPELVEDEEVHTVETTAADFAGKVTDSSIEQVERQLRELSDAELKEIVVKVAGPVIKKLAGEMLEQIAWDVVPDLAEAMIGEEIRKIKQGTE
jgi:DNA-binding response OmpR family regulator